MNSSAKRLEVAVIGGGFSGIMTAVNLSRFSRDPLHIQLINQHRPLGRGVAYGTRRMEHLLNVAARNMSAFPDLPDHFLRWLRTRSEYDTVPDRELREKFIPRMVYGDYLRGLMQQYLETPADPATLSTTFVEGEAMDVEPDGEDVAIRLAGGERVKAQRVVLATGNEAPAELPGAAELENDPAWVGNPWHAWEHRLPPYGGTIVLLGTGLTTIDAVVTLRAVGWQGVVHAVSRNGWLPHAHFRGIEYPEFPPAGVDLAKLGLKGLVSLMEEHCGRLREQGHNPAIIVDKMRSHTQRVWQHFTLAERKEFARQHAARWNVLRHRIAPEIHSQVATAQLIGQLHVHRGAIERVEADNGQVRVHLDGAKSLAGDLVINATGPHTKFVATKSPLLQNLLRRGFVTPDEMEMGVRVDPDHTVIGRDGSRSEVFLAVGPLLRGTLWETVAVPELRGQARAAAETLLRWPHAPAKREPEVMMEYMI